MFVRRVFEILYIWNMPHDSPHNPWRMKWIWTADLINSPKKEVVGTSNTFNLEESYFWVGSKEIFKSNPIKDERHVWVISNWSLMYFKVSFELYPTPPSWHYLYSNLHSIENIGISGIDNVWFFQSNFQPYSLLTNGIIFSFQALVICCNNNC